MSKESLFLASALLLCAGCYHSVTGFAPSSTHPANPSAAETPVVSLSDTLENFGTSPHAPKQAATSQPSETHDSMHQEHQHE